MTKAWKYIWIIFTVFLLASCQTTTTFFLGDTVEKEHLIPINVSADDQKWSTFDLDIAYSYTRNNDVFDIQGQVRLSQHYRMNYDYIPALDVYLVFLDSTSKVIGTTYLVRNYTYLTEAAIPFDIQSTAPPETVAFSFAYEGSATESGDGGGFTASYWLFPQ